jgi:hypothetical protein
LENGFAIKGLWEEMRGYFSEKGTQDENAASIK